VTNQSDKEFPWQRKEVNLLCVDERLGKEFEWGRGGGVWLQSVAVYGFLF